MRQVTIGDKEITIHGSPLTPWIYEEEFGGADMAADANTFLTAGATPVLKALPKMAWAMAKSAVYPAPFPDFITWIMEVGGYDFGDEALGRAVVFEASKACFPGREKVVQAAEDAIARQRAKKPADDGAATDGQATGDESD